MHPDDLTGEQLRHAAAIADGAVDVDSFDPWALFLRVADVMERWWPDLNQRVTSGLTGHFLPAACSACRSTN